MSITRRSRYYKDTYRVFTIKLNRDKDADYISFLETCPNVTQAVRDLIDKGVIEYEVVQAERH